MDMENVEPILIGAIAVMVGLAATASAAQAYTPKLEHICPICGVRFATYDELYEHFIAEHRAEPIDIDIVLVRFEHLYCSNFYRTIVNGWPVDRITFNWKVTSLILPVTILAGQFYVTGPEGERLLLNASWYGSNEGHKTLDCVMGAHTAGITSAGIYPYRVIMKAFHWDGSKNIELCAGEYIGEIQYRG